MEDNKNNFEKIDDFIMGNLKDEELSAFEFELENNEALSMAVAQQRKLFLGIRKAGRNEFIKDLKDIHKNVIEDDGGDAKVRRFNWRPLLAIAAVSVLVIASWWMMTTPTTDNESLFATNYEPYSFNQNLRDFQQDKDLIKAAELYRNKNYKESLPIFQNAMKDNSSSALKMAIATSHFENGEPKKAIYALQDIIDTEDPFLSDLAHWYSALFYLHLKQKDNAATHLESLVLSDQNDKYLEAKRLLEKLQ